MTVTIRYFVGVALCASLAVPAATWGQATKGGKTAEPRMATEIEEVVVTAQKREEKLQDVPVAVTAVTGDLLENTGIQVESQLSRITPNLHLTFNANFVAPYLRGVGTNYANPGLESTVGLYLDDLYMSRASSGMFNFSDIERVEVLKGPQGTLFGRNTSAGAIRILTRDPQPELEASVALTYGRFDRRAIETTINVPITKQLSARVTYNHDENDGFVENIDPTRPTLGNRYTDMLAGKLLYKPTEDLRIKLSGDYSEKNDYEGAAFINLYDSAPQQVGIALGGRPSTGFYTFTGNQPRSGATGEVQHTLIWGGALRADYTLPWFTVSSITGFRVNQFNGSADLDTVDIPFLHAQTSLERTIDTSEEIQVVSHDTGNWSYTAGVYYLHEQARDIFRVYGAAISGAVAPSNLSNPNLGYYPLDPVTQAGDGTIKINSIAPYAQVSYTFLDRITLTGGLRYTYEEKELSSNKVFLTGLLPNGADLVLYPEDHNRIHFDKVTPKVTLDYKPIDNLLVYVTYSEGFKSGGFNLPNFLPKVDTVEPETLTSYELGWKTEFFRRLRFNGAAFYYEYKDLVVQRTDQATGGTRAENAASAYIRGVEGDFSAQATERLQLGAGFGLLKANFGTYFGDAYVPAFQTPACTPENPAGCLGFAVQQNTNFSGGKVPNAPEVTGYLRGQYDQPVASGYGHVLLSSLINYEGKTYYDSERRNPEFGRFLLSASATWYVQGDKYFLSFFGDNLLDKEYNTMKTPQGSGGWRVPAPPRTWGVKVGASL